MQAGPPQQRSNWCISASRRRCRLRRLCAVPGYLLLGRLAVRELLGNRACTWADHRLFIARPDFRLDQVIQLPCRGA